MKLKLNLNKNDKYVVACSFGPDSMALLDAVIKQKFNVIVAHVNYHHRQESDYEEKQLSKYCFERNIPIEILNLFDNEIEGNFENWAREKRYKFFADVCKKHNTKSVLVGHHQDDLIETFIMQKKRDKYVKYWGIAEKNEINGVSIIRPLLSFKKVDLVKYCEDNLVPFSIDKTNCDLSLERNKIRSEIISNLTNADRENIIREIKEQKHEKIMFKSIWSLDEFSSLSYDQFISIMIVCFDAQNEHRNLSKKEYSEIQKKLKSKKANIEIMITNGISIYVSYGFVYLVNKKRLSNYSITLNKPACIKNELFDIDFSDENYNDRNVKISDYPIMIRNVSNTDDYYINGYKVAISRLFLDWKMPSFLRTVWPGVFNAENKLVYIPRYRRDFTDNHKTKFTFLVDYFLIKKINKSK